MKLTMLGTGHAAAVECYNTCFVLSEKDKYFLVDAGGGNQILMQLKKAGIPVEQIHDIFVTHEHIDHLLGVFWMIRIIGQKINQKKYEGDLNIYCHSELAGKIESIARLTIMPKIIRLLGGRIRIVAVEDGEKRKIIDHKVKFFDIGSRKAKQYGFTLKLDNERKFTCLGDEPYNPENYEEVRKSEWLMHEAFCLYSQNERFKPYEKSHSTVKDACQAAAELKVPNLILYHTEDENLPRRKHMYTEEGRQYYRGNLFVPDDLEVIKL
ncbi:MBL fold metallo-hydrolase [Murimonas intestini]|uniref:MBL fold metallo-hydrolase n=1 Tax=Murimonas intestini TaxID=1337051 RepID=UPI0011DDF96C|nr:MBL fold metallo-hydrolase [Murimonas intestini]